MNSGIGRITVMNKNIIKIVWPIIALILLSGILLLERGGLPQNEQESEVAQNYEEVDELSYSAPVSQDVQNLIIYQSQNATDQVYYEGIKEVLSEMKVSYDIWDLSQSDQTVDLSKYQDIVLVTTDIAAFGDNFDTLVSWVEEGGSLLNIHTYTLNDQFRQYMDKMGVTVCENDYVAVEGMHINDEFMIGGGRDFTYEDTMDGSLNVVLDKTCNVGITATNSGIPLLWSHDYGKGRFVVMNQSAYGKEFRGVYATACSLMENIYAYPVINASAFYIDDFPSPVPSGNSDYIRRDYNISVSDFYTNSWWPTLLSWEKEFGIRHTGMVIEDYSDQVEEPFSRQGSTSRFTFFGNMLINKGGELGWHGYNHMPLCLSGFDYEGLYDSYKLFESQEAIKASLQELQAFTEEIFPNQQFSVYVPPSNILSEEGRKVIAENFSNIKAIASTYLPGQCGYAQEFGIGEDGIVNTPRIVAGEDVDEYSQMVAFSELNFHFVQSHFLHPDDALDPDRGAALGWKELAKRFHAYLKYIYTSAPTIRNVTGSEMASAVAQYSNLTMKREVNGNQYTIKMGGFSGEAYLCVRLNTTQIASVSGGEYEHLTGNLYLIHATQDTVVINGEEAF